MPEPEGVRDDDEQPKPSDDTARPADADPAPSPDPGRGAPSSLVGEEDALSLIHI